MTYLFLIAVCVISFYAYAQLNKVSKAQKQREDIKEENKISLQNEAKEMISKHHAKASLLCQSDSVLPKIPKGDLCYLLADDEKLTIMTRSTPTITYYIQYTQIQLFKTTEIKALERDLVGRFGTPVEQEALINKVIIQYIQADNTLNELTFIYGNTNEDKFYNEQALAQADIFSFVNKQIPQQTYTANL